MHCPLPSAKITTISWIMKKNKRSQNDSDGAFALRIPYLFAENGIAACKSVSCSIAIVASASDTHSLCDIKFWLLDIYLQSNCIHWIHLNAAHKWENNHNFKWNKCTSLRFSHWSMSTAQIRMLTAEVFDATVGHWKWWRIEMIALTQLCRTRTMWWRAAKMVHFRWFMLDSNFWVLNRRKMLMLTL